MTEKVAHQAWARLNKKSPRAGTLMHYLVSMLGHQNAVVINQRTLAKLMEAHPRTIQRAVKDLIDANFVQVVRLNGPGSVSAYIVNDRVAWGQRRADMPRLSLFSAQIVADEEDQQPDALSVDKLHRIPLIGERQLPSGPDEDPPSQPFIEGMEPDLPAIGGGDREEIDRFYDNQGEVK